MSFLNTLSLQSRFLLAPLVGLLLAILLYVAGLGIIRSHTEVLYQVSQSDLPHIARFNQLTLELNQSNIEFTSLLLSAIQNNDEERVYRESRGILKQLQDHKKSFEQLVSNGYVPANKERAQLDKALRQAIETSFSEYRTAVISAIELATVDAKRAQDELLRASQSLTKLNQGLTTLSNSHAEALIASGQSIKQTLVGQRWIQPAAVLLIALMIFISIALARRMSQHLLGINNGLVALAEGKLETDLPSTGESYLEGQEQALRTFRDVLKDNLRQQRLLEAHLQALTDSEKRYQELLNITATAIIVLNEQQQIIFFNKSAETLFGYSSETMLGNTLDTLLPEDIQGRHSQLISQFAQSDSDAVTGMSRSPICGQNKDGDLIWLDISIARIHLSQDQLMIASITDITERIQSERELSNYQEQLESMVQRRTQELQEATAYAQSANQSKSKFLANMSHEIRTPMNAIIGMSHLALQGDLGQRERDYIDKVSLSAKNLLGILNDILDLSKIEADKLEIDHSEFNLANLLEQVQQSTLVKINNKHQEWQLTIADSLPDHLIGDALRLTQVLTNLCDNASKFSPEHGHISLDVSIQHQDDQYITLLFSVQDDGIGISEDAKARLFQPFNQADSTTTRRFGGTGLGLAISRHLVELMGGQINVESTPDHGSRFFFNAQFQVPEEISEQSTKSSQEIQYEQAVEHLQGAHLLLVEDNEINQELAIELLNSHGIQTTMVDNGQKAVDILKTQSFDGVLMDCQMPVLDGYAATSAIRNELGLHQLPVIAMTANTMRGDRTRALESGMNDHIGKPLDIEKMLITIAHWVHVGDESEPMPTPMETPHSDELIPDHLAGIDIEAGLYVVQQKRSLYRRVLGMFVESNKTFVSSFRQHWEAGELDVVQRQAHSLKSSAANIGALAVSEAAKQLESACREHPELIGPRLQALEPLLDEVLKGLQALN